MPPPPEEKPSASNPSVAAAPPTSSDSANAARRLDDATQEGGIGRYAFYFVWLVALPLTLAVGSVWLLTPAPSTVDPNRIRVWVAEQQIPACIVLFTMFAMSVWRFRHALPFAALVGVGGRSDIPASVRPRFEDAGILLEEARRIIRANRREIERELTAQERDQISVSLAELERTMVSEAFDQGEFDAAHARADRIVGEHLSRWRKGELREYGESIGIAVAVAMLLRALVVEAFKIPSGSMIPTLMIGDHIFVNKLAYGPLVPFTDKRLFTRLPPQRGDVMVFKWPEDKEKDFIKRVIAAPGDTLEAINGRPVINGWIAPHCYVGQLRNENRISEMFVEYLEDKSYFTLFDVNPDEQTCSATKDCGMGGICKAGICGVYQGPFHASQEEVWVMGDNRNNSHDSRTWRGGIGAGVPFENIKGRAMFVWMSFGPGGSIQQDRLFVNVLGQPKLPSAQEVALQPAVDKCLRERPSIAETTPPRAAPHR